MIAVADSGPIHYLILLGEVNLLQRLYGDIRIPQAVVRELSVASAPSDVANWIRDPPEWVHLETVMASSAIAATTGAGESEAIVLACALPAEVLLMDDRAGRQEGRRRGLEVTGTLGILRIAAERGLIDVPMALKKLRATNFYLDDELLGTVFGKWLPD